MSTQALAKKYYTPEEYLAMEETAEYRSEYYKGEIFAMAGGSFDHNLIVFDFGFAIDSRLKDTKCLVLANEMRLWIKAKNLFTYPDLMVVCGKPEFYEDRTDTITNPMLIAEVLPDSAKNYDRGEKFKFYRTIPTFQEYILIDQYEVHVEQFYFDSEKRWIFVEYNHINDILKLNTIDVEVPLRDIYRRVEIAKRIVKGE